MNVSQRKFIIGDNWLYVKLYSGTSMLDSILKNQLFKLVDALSIRKLIDNFFFIRYFDDAGNHLRLRFHLTDTKNIYEIINMLNIEFGEFVQKRIIHKIVVDTYSREIERYGAENIEDVELVFGMHSWMVLDYLNKTENDDDERPIFALSCIDTILSTFGLSDNDKYIVCETSYQAFAVEFSINHLIKDALKIKYRNIKPQLNGDLFKSYTKAFQANSPFFKAQIYLQSVHNILKNHVTLNAISENSFVRTSLLEILRSIVHMQCNRIFISKQRQHEFVMCYILSNFYKSRSIMANKTLSNES